jgi:hypothetical protein
MSIAELIRAAPLVPAEDLTDFWNLIRSNTLRCVKIAVDFGPEYHTLNHRSRQFVQAFGEDRQVDLRIEFLVDGDFDPRSDYRMTHGYYGQFLTVRPDTPNVFPMPISKQSTLTVRGKIVVAAFSDHRWLRYGVFQRIGDWLVSPDLSRFDFLPKDYVLQKHLHVFAFSFDPGCGCCAAGLTTDAAERQTEKNTRHRTWLVDRLLCAPLSTCASIVDDFGEDVVARFLDPTTGPHYSPPFCTMRLAKVRETLRWDCARRDVIRALQSGSAFSEDPELSFLCDPRLKSKRCTKRLSSFTGGSVVLFL